MSLAPLHSDIIWANFFSQSFITTIKGYLINLLVFTLALTFVTPVYFMEFLKKSGVTDTVEYVSINHGSALAH